MFRGQIIDESTDLPVEGATVLLDLDTEDDVIDYEATTGAFGFYRLENVPPGAYELRVEHIAFETVMEDVSPLSGETLRKSYALTRKAVYVGKELYTLYIQVRGAVSNWGLRYVPVTIQRFENAGDASPTHEWKRNADANGFVNFFAPPQGYYRFLINQPGELYSFAGWESYTTEGTAQDKVFVDQSYMASLYLKPIYQSLTFNVIGNDPKEGDGYTDVPLEDIYVEITGFDPFDDTQLMPTQVGRTDENGQITFEGLPGICYQYRCRKYGRYTQYGFYSGEIDDTMPYSTTRGIFPSDTIDESMDVPYNSLNIRVTTAYDREGFDYDAPLATTGVVGSNSEGYYRTGQAYSYEPVYDNTHNFLIAGKYRSELQRTAYVRTLTGIELAPGVSGYSTFYMQLQGSTTFEFMPGYGYTTPSPVIEAEIIPTEVQGRLVAADERSNLGAPDYRPLANKTFEFVEREGANLLPYGMDIIEVTTDEYGRFSLSLMPGIYGIRIDGMDDYYGKDVIITVLDSTNSDYYYFGGSITAWPTIEGWKDQTEYYDKSYEISQKMNLNGLAIDSGQDIDMEIRLEKELHSVEAVFNVQNDPTRSLVLTTGETGNLLESLAFSALIASNTMATLSDGVNTYQAKLEPHPSLNYRLVARFEAVAPGQDYELSINHPNYTCTPDTTVSFYDWPEPGYTPDELGFDTTVSDSIYTQSTPFGEYTINAVVESNFNTVPLVQFRTYYSSTEEYGNTLETYPSYIKFDGVSGVYALASGAKATASWSGWCNISGKWFQVGPGSLILINGPQATPEAAPPQFTSDLSVRSFYANDPTEEITGLTFHTGDAVIRTTPFAQSNYAMNNRPAKLGATDNWLWVEGSPILTSVSLNGDQPSLEYTVWASQGYEIKVTVTNQLTSEPLVNVPVRLYTTTGGPANEDLYDALIRTDENGVATFNSLYYADYFANIYAPGFEAQNFRLPISEAETVDDDHSLEFRLNKTLGLTPLPSPTIHTTGVPFNRAGAFLPGISRAGNQSVLNGFSAEEVLTMDWEIEASPTPHSYQLTEFDQADGSTSPASTINVSDEIVAAYLIDQRQFTNDFFSSEPVSNYTPEGQEPWLMRNYLNRLGASNSLSNEQQIQWHQKLTQTTVGENGATSRKFTGKVKLWELPPGDFDPAIVIITRLGAVGVYEVPYIDFPEKRLQGIPIPPWLGFAFDMIGFTAGVSATQDQIKEYVPNGKFIPFPEFSATIDLDDDDDQYINYEYALTLVQKEGQDSPGGDTTSVAQGILGGEFKTEGKITVPGKDRKIDFTVESTLSKEDIDISEYTPALMKNFDIEAEITAISGSVSTTASANIDPEAPWQARLTNVVTFNMDSAFRMNLTPVLGKIPYAGPALLSLDATGLLTFYGATEAGVGVQNTFTWTTLRPQNTFSSTTDPEPRQPRQHYLGGSELSDAEASSNGIENSYLLCFRFAFGIDAEAIGGNAGASGRISLTGNECAGLPSTAVEFNDFGDWPMINRISGGINVELDGYLNTPIKNFSKSWSWNLLTFDVQFGTENIFQMIPLDIADEVQDLAAYPIPDFMGSNGQVMDNFTPLADLSVGNETGFLFTEYDSSTGEVVLKLATPAGDFGYNDPIEIAREGYVGESAVLALDDGRTLIAWSAVDLADASDPLAQADLRYAISDINGNFSGPADITQLNGQSSQLQLHESGSLITAIWIDTPGAFSSSSDTLCLSEFSSGSWSAVETVGDPRQFELMTVASGGPSGPDYLDIFRVIDQVLYGFDYPTVQAFRWDGAALSLFDDQVAGTYGSFQGGTAYGEPDGTFVFITNPTNSGLFRYVLEPEGTNYVRDNDFVLTDLPRQLKVCYLDDATAPVVAYVWTSGTMNGTEIYYAFSDPDGNLLAGPNKLTGNPNGRYYDVQITALDNREFEVHALFENSPVELRKFIVSYDEGLSINDSDGDSMLDLAEYLIIDFSSDDGTELLTDVLPDDDFDGDTFSNLVEANAGSDPTDPTSIPDSDGVTVVVASNAEEFGPVAGAFTVTRPGGDVSQPLDVLYTVGGTATPDADYTALSSLATIPAQSTATQILVTPLADTDAEGAESIIVNLVADDAYTLGSPSSATLTLKDKPTDDWRYRMFGENLGQPGTALDEDYELDGVKNLLEFALALDPSVSDEIDLPQIVTVPNPGNGKRYLTLTYTESVDATDLTFTVQVSNDPNSGWVSGPSNVVEVTSDPAPTDSEGNPIRTFRDTTAIEDDIFGHRFIRLRVTD
ncbi:carboxypeptidase regulatory-like domain-containing protein [Cerasicoccus frondis]|uniref:carboxypeptidase regulatory-like domain-containing protein n=1 Tax=Cerasicoccus frondis TaxID=490090 RepID=UPI0028527758|nr:carboxypeptidase regulatory-like domain-containing protein [Cerasicoccus frondis]